MPLKELAEVDEYGLVEWMYFIAPKDKSVMFKRRNMATHTVGYEDSTENTTITEFEVIGLEVPGSLVFYTDLLERTRLNRLVCSMGVARLLENSGVLSFAGRVEKEQVKKMPLLQANLLKL